MKDEEKAREQLVNDLQASEAQGKRAEEVHS